MTNRRYKISNPDGYDYGIQYVRDLEPNSVFNFLTLWGFLPPTANPANYCVESDAYNDVIQVWNYKKDKLLFTFTAID